VAANGALCLLVETGPGSRWILEERVVEKSPNTRAGEKEEAQPPKPRQIRGRGRNHDSEGKGESSHPMYLLEAAVPIAAPRKKKRTEIPFLPKASEIA